MAAKKPKNKVYKKKKHIDAQDQENKNTMTVNLTTQSIKQLKVRKPIRIAVMVLCVLAMSCLFEGWRQVQQGLTFNHIFVLFSGIISTAFLLWLQAFWIYLEEKYKGTLRKRIEHFEKLEAYWQRKKNKK